MTGSIRYRRSLLVVAVAGVVVVSAVVSVVIQRGNVVWDGGDATLFDSDQALIAGSPVACETSFEAFGLVADSVASLGMPVVCESAPDGVVLVAVGHTGRIEVYETSALPFTGTSETSALDSWNEVRKGSALVDVSEGVLGSVRWLAAPADGWGVLDRWEWQNAGVEWVYVYDGRTYAVTLTVRSPDPNEALALGRTVMK